MKIALAQTQFLLGDFDHNEKQVLCFLKQSYGKADLLVFPEGGLWGYPPKDFLFCESYFKIQNKKLKSIHKHLKKGMSLLLPAFTKNKDEIQNGVFLFQKNKAPEFFAKQFLANTGVFFEARYFKTGLAEKNVFQIQDKKIQVLICEDLWNIEPKNKAEILIALNASPYSKHKQKNRFKKMGELAKKFKAPALYLNSVGAQDSLIFDGGSFALNPKGQLIWQGAFFKPDFKILSFKQLQKKSSVKKQRLLKLPEEQKQALILGIKSFFKQTGFSQALLGLSGGMDSSLVAYLASQALGAKNVKAYFLPGPYTSPLSYKIAFKLAKNLKISLKQQSISFLFETFVKEIFGLKKTKSITVQNLQARLRMLVLMAKANETQSLLLSTGNKSEIGVGYLTLYGDSAGALSPLGDLLKSQVYEMARFINKKTPVFPKALLKREPSAELAPRQKDRDDLPPYKELDAILLAFLANKPPSSLTAKALFKRIQSQEFKRAQSPVILKLTEKDFGDSWKRPIAHKFSLSPATATRSPL